jgi:hypothetical protein
LMKTHWERKKSNSPPPSPKRGFLKENPHIKIDLLLLRGQNP